MKQSNEKMTRNFDEKHIKNGPWGSPWGSLEGPWRAPGTLPGPPGDRAGPFLEKWPKNRKENEMVAQFKRKQIETQTIKKTKAE